MFLEKNRHFFLNPRWLAAPIDVQELLKYADSHLQMDAAPLRPAFNKK